MKKIFLAAIAFAFTSSAYATNLFDVCYRDVKPEKVYIGRIVISGNTASIYYLQDNGNWTGLTGSIPGDQLKPNADGYKILNLTMYGSNGYKITNMNIEVTPVVVRLWQYGDRPQVHPRIPCP